MRTSIQFNLGSKFGQGGYKTNGGLQGVGASNKGAQIFKNISARCISTLIDAYGNPVISTFST